MKLRDKMHGDMEGFFPGKKQYGMPPAVALINPKHARNVGAALRASMFTNFGTPATVSR